MPGLPLEELASQSRDRHPGPSIEVNKRIKMDGHKWRAERLKP